MGEKYADRLERSQETNGMNDVVSFGVQIQRRVNQGDCPANTEITVLGAYLIHSPVNIRPVLSSSLLWEQRQLRYLICRCKAADFYGETSDRPSVGMAASGNIHGSLPYSQSAVGWAGQLELAVKGGQIIGTDSYSYGRIDAVLLPQTCRNALAQCHQCNLDIISTCRQSIQTTTFLKGDTMNDFQAKYLTEEMAGQITEAMEMELALIPGQVVSLSDIQRRLGELEGQFNLLLERAAEQMGDQDCMVQFQTITNEIAALKERRSQMETQQKANELVMQRMGTAVSLLEMFSPELTEWDEVVVRQLVDTVEVLSEDTIKVYLRGGIEIQRSMEN